jgi:hypothetical protein
MNKKKQILEEDAAKTYNEFKVFGGRKYTGMRVGGRHKWYYEKGEWNEKKVTPDRWEFTYAVRNGGRAMRPRARGFRLALNTTGTFSHIRTYGSLTRILTALP